MNYTQLSAAISAYTENTEDNFIAEIPVFVQQAEQRIYNTVQFPSLRKNVTGTVTANNKYLSCPEDFLAVYSLAVVDGTGSYEYLLNKDVNFIRQAYPQPTDTAIPKYYALFGPAVSGATISNELSFILGPTPDATYAVELHYYYYPVSIVQGAITALNVYDYGSNLTDGVYYNVPLTTLAPSGSSAKATIVVSAGAVQSVTITDGGTYYVANTVVTCAATDIGDVGGSGFPFYALITTVSNPTGTTWLGDNFDTVLLYGALVEAYTYMKGETDMMQLYDGKYKEALELAKRLGDGMERQDAYRSGQVRIKVK